MFVTSCSALGAILDVFDCTETVRRALAVEAIFSRAAKTGVLRARISKTCGTVSVSL